MTERPRAFRTFVEDLAHAFGAWRRVPLLPILSVAIAAGPYIVQELSNTAAGTPECFRAEQGCGPLVLIVPWASLIFTVLFAGWYGTERIWYLRTFRGQTLRREEMWPLTSAFRWRFIALGFLVFIVTIPAFVAAFLPKPVWWTVFILWWFAVDAAITFATPALAFSTRSVFAAIRKGLRFTRQTWPTSAPYLLIPPVAARLATAVLWNNRISVGYSVLADVIAVSLNVLFKGATVSFYLRHHEVEENGAAFLGTSEEVQG